MPFNSLVSRSDVVIPDEVSSVIIKNVTAKNPILSLARRLPNMSASARSMPVMSALATAYFVSGDTGLKQTSEVNWTNKFIHAEELAVIVPIPENVLDDTNYDIWGETRPAVEEAIGVAIAQAILYGTNIPAQWTTDLGAAGIVAGATAASQVLSAAAYADLYEAVLGETAGGVAGVFMAVEADGFAVTGSVAHPLMKGKLRNLRASDGMPIFKTSMQQVAGYELDGTPIYFPNDGSIVSGSSWMVSGQWDQLVYSIRKDITYKILTEAVIQDAAGNIIYNLAQQDMVALRAVIRLGFALPNPINRMNQVAASRYPFAVLTA